MKDGKLLFCWNKDGQKSSLPHSITGKGESDQYNRILPLLQISAVSVDANKNVYDILKRVVDLTDINNFTLQQDYYIRAMDIL